MDLAIYLIVFAVLIACAAFFSASEFAISKVRSAQINHPANGKDKNTLIAKKITGTDNYQLSGQIWFVLSVFGVSWISYGTIVKRFESFMMATNLSDNARVLLTFSFTLAAAVLAMAVFGKLAQNTVKIQNSHSVALGGRTPVVRTNRLPAFFGWLLKSTVNSACSLFRLRRFSHYVGYAEEDFKKKLAKSYQNGNINPFKYTYASRVLEFNCLLAKEIMVPRTEMSTFQKHLTLKEVICFDGAQKFTRYPVIDEDKDHVIGYINMKHLLTAYANDASVGDSPIALYTHPIIQVIGSMTIGDLLLKMQREQTHMAVLKDEYGGTCGLLTLEDILEEIIGDIRDEFDADEIPQIRKNDEHHYVLDAKLRIEEVNRLLGIDISDEDIDTIGGWFMSRCSVTIEKQKITEQGYDFHIKDMEGHHIHYLEVHKTLKSEHNTT